MYDNACRKCYFVYKIAFGHEGSFEETVDKRNAEESFLVRWDTAVVVFEKLEAGGVGNFIDIRDFFPRKVAKKLNAGLRSFVRFRGLNATQFKTRFNAPIPRTMVLQNLPYPFFRHRSTVDVCLLEMMACGGHAISMSRPTF